MGAAGLRWSRSLGLRLTPDRRRAFSIAWRAFWISRLLIWAAGILAVLVFGAGTYRLLNPGLPDPSETLSGLLLSPANRWDAVFYLEIAQDGYADSAINAAFFPLYPLLIRAVGEPIDALGLAGAHPFEFAGLLVSLAAFIVALYLLHRLTDLELGPKAADNTVMLLALFPTSFFFSAIYTESVFLALSVGCVYSARRGWWWRAGALGALASATRSQGLVLLLPLMLMLWYGPRTKRMPVHARRGTSRTRFPPAAHEVAALLLVPLGLLAFIGYVAGTTDYGVNAPFEAQKAWGREFKGPIVGIWRGVESGASAARDLFEGGSLKHAREAGVRSQLVNLAALAIGAIGVVGALRRLRIPYGAYALAGLLFAISYPPEAEPLTSLPRFIVVLFPIFMWAGFEMTHWRRRNVALAASAVALACFSAAFASGYWIA
jgi:hypothetical protein